MYDVAGILDAESGKVGKRLAGDENVAGGFAETGTVAVGADFLLFGIGFGGAFFFVDLGFGFGVEAFCVECSCGDMAVAAAGFAPAARGVEGEVVRVEFFEGFAGGWGNTGGGEGVEVAFFGEDTKGPFAVLQGDGEVVVDRFVAL